MAALDHRLEGWGVLSPLEDPARPEEAVDEEQGSTDCTDVRTAAIAGPTDFAGSMQQLCVGPALPEEAVRAGSRAALTVETCAAPPWPDPLAGWHAQQLLLLCRMAAAVRFGSGVAEQLASPGGVCRYGPSWTNWS